MCKRLGIHIVNGRSKSDIHGEYTFISTRGKSIIDYMLLSAYLFQYLSDFRVLDIDITEHLPLHCQLNLDIPLKGQSNCVSTSSIRKYKWLDANKDVFLSRLRDSFVFDNIKSFKDFMLRDCINEGVETLCEMIRYAGECMKVTPRNPKTQQEWWDKVCDQMKRQKYELLNRFRKQIVTMT